MALLTTDKVVGGGATTLAHLGITPQSVEAILPTYIRRGAARG